MALWTFKAEIVPQEALSGKRELSEEEFDKLCPRLWESRDADEVAREFSGLLPPLKSWHEQLSLFGVAGSDRIEVWREAGRVTNITLKVDCRAPNIPFIDTVEALAT